MFEGMRRLAVLTAGLTAMTLLQPTLAAAQSPSAGASAAGAVGDANYKLGTGDKMRVIVFGEPSLSGEFTISDTGEVAFPLIGSVHAAGLTVQEFDEALRGRLADGYLKDPRVSAEVENYRPFYILGEVQKPGEYPYTNGLTIMNAVATAGGFSYRANTKIVTVRHAGASKEEAVKVTAATPVGPGDTIVIRERFF
jgi:protein involved in polysaccharide export with SLBB domain